MYNDQAARYRDRAQDMRRLAERAHNERLRYLSMAEDWERLAEDTERAASLTRAIESH
jgi:hypothetical protein